VTGKAWFLAQMAAGKEVSSSEEEEDGEEDAFEVEVSGGIVWLLCGWACGPTRSLVMRWDSSQIGCCVCFSRFNRVVDTSAVNAGPGARSSTESKDAAGYASELEGDGLLCCCMQQHSYAIVCSVCCMLGAVCLAALLHAAC
jgi:hypothetical protein